MVIPIGTRHRSHATACTCLKLDTSRAEDILEGLVATLENIRCQLAAVDIDNERSIDGCVRRRCHLLNACVSLAVADDQRLIMASFSG